MNRRAVLLAVPAVVAVVLLGACGSDDAEPVDAAALEGTVWGDAVVEGYDLAGTLTMQFQDGQVGVSGGCNQLNGAYTLEDGVLTAGPFITTLMACPDELMDQDQWITGQLEAGLEVALDGDTLTLSNDDVTITLTRVT